jgi:hypothetical protein
MKLHALHGSVMPAGGTVLLGLIIHHAKVMANRPNLGCCIPLCGFLAVI